MCTYLTATENHRPSLQALLCEAFGVSEESVEAWIARSGLPDWRVVEGNDREVKAALVRVPAGQWYGGRVVPMIGVAGVAVSLSARSQGTGYQLMRSFLEEAEHPLSVLYGSTTEFYRKLGYERAGSLHHLEIKVRDVPKVGGSAELRPLSWDQWKEKIAHLYHQSKRSDGNLVRENYLWERVRRRKGREARVFGLFESELLTGYFFYSDVPGDLDKKTAVITDLVLTTPESLKSFFRFLYSQRSFYTKVCVDGHPGSPLLHYLPDRWNYKVELVEQWMLRIVRVKEALEMRGYPRGVTAEIELAVEDGLLKANHGNWILRVDGGRATLCPGGNGTVKLTEKALAALYTGFMCPEDLRLTGALTGPAEELQVLGELFRGEAKLGEFF